MTCREKFISIHPSYSKEDVDRVVRVACPGEYNFLDDPEWCRTMAGPDRCVKCWDREIPEINDVAAHLPPEEVTELYGIIDKAMTPKPASKKTKAELLSEIDELKEQIKKLEQYNMARKAADDLAVFRDAFVDAGFTREEAMEMIFTAAKFATR